MEEKFSEIPLKQNNCPIQLDTIILIKIVFMFDIYPTSLLQEIYLHNVCKYFPVLNEFFCRKLNQFDVFLDANFEDFLILQQFNIIFEIILNTGKT